MWTGAISSGSALISGSALRDKFNLLDIIPRMACELKPELGLFNVTKSVVQIGFSEFTMLPKDYNFRCVLSIQIHHLSVNKIQRLIYIRLDNI